VSGAAKKFRSVSDNFFVALSFFCALLPATGRWMARRKQAVMLARQAPAGAGPGIFEKKLEALTR
jgi:hypothetical protein